MWVVSSRLVPRELTLRPDGSRALRKSLKRRFQALSALQARNSHPQLWDLAGADHHLGRRGVGKDQEEAALEVRSDFFDLSQIHQDLAPGAKEHSLPESRLQLGELIVHPKGL